VKGEDPDNMQEEITYLELDSSNLVGKTVYFVRTGNNDELNNDNFGDLVAWGELNQHSADSLKNLMHHCMLPFLKQANTARSWGLCEE